MKLNSLVSTNTLSSENTISMQGGKQIVSDRPLTEKKYHKASAFVKKVKEVTR